jgi:hypothetical protein
MATTDEKADISRVDIVDGGDKPLHFGDEQIIANLQATGEEVGLTWRSVMAAIVSTSSHVLQRWNPDD